MAQPTVLERFSRQLAFQRFNPCDEDHLKAYAFWRLHGRLHPTLRFHMEDPYVNIPSMMEAKIAAAWLDQHPGLVERVRDEVVDRMVTA